MIDAIERWLAVIGFEGLYEVSDWGRVRSLDRRSAARNKWNQFDRQTHGRILTQRVGKRGYLLVRLWRNGKGSVFPVHRLVGEAFLGPLPVGLDTRHGPAGKLVNSVANLSYGTRAENEHDKTRDNTQPLGSARPGAKLTESIVRECRERYAAGSVSYAELAAEFGVTHLPMYKAINGLTWRHV